tara:strand:+ start:1684 stop:2187 length:504 start_codon:yes stop_codon:yes gene_type:complete
MSLWVQLIANKKLSSIQPETWLHLKRVVRFGDTDSAGVIHFYQLLRWCHEAWEESLELYGLSSIKIFPSINKLDCPVEILLPIVHCEANFYLPIEVGDHLAIELFPERVDQAGFQVKTKFMRDNITVGIGIIFHKSINAKTRKGCQLPHDISLWLEASSLKRGITPV